jgi:hypothetical protein
MSKRRRKRKGCSGKTGHDTKEDAYAEMRALLKKNFIFHHVKPYKCKKCGKFHIGRTKKIIYNRFNELI